MLPKWILQLIEFILQLPGVLTTRLQPTPTHAVTYLEPAHVSGGLVHMQLDVRKRWAYALNLGKSSYVHMCVCASPPLSHIVLHVPAHRWHNPVPLSTHPSPARLQKLGTAALCNFRGKMSGSKTNKPQPVKNK